MKVRKRETKYWAKIYYKLKELEKRKAKNLRQLGLPVAVTVANVHSVTVQR